MKKKRKMFSGAVEFSVLGFFSFFFVCVCWGLMTRQPLRVILYHLPEKGRNEIEEIVEEMKKKDRERGKGKKVKKQKK